MKPVRMLRNERIAVDGVQVRWYRVGEILHVPDPLAQALIRDGVATDDLTPKQEIPDSKPLAHQPKAEYSNQPKAKRK